jgi:hypothetical protein
MSRFLNTTGNATLGVGICDRCRRKFPIDQLKPDRDNKGLLVCDEDNDEIDRYKLPARKPESVTLRHIRQDVDLTNDYRDAIYVEDGYVIDGYVEDATYGVL